jgi:flagellar biosynthetic protein FliR
MIEGLAQLIDMGEDALFGLVLVFMRVGGIVALLPGFGEQNIPMRVRLGLAAAFTAVVWPMIAPDLLALEPERPFLVLMLIEGGIGLLVGLSFRLLVMALQLAGSIAAQSTSLAQVLGASVTPDPMPALGNILVLGGITLALTAGLHVKAAIAMAGSYSLLPLGALPEAGDVATWGVARVADAFAFGFTLAAPFVLAAVVYNVALGAISKAMPQLMVAFVGAPAITGASILILLLAAPLILQVWNGRLDAILANPLGLPR